MRIEKKREAELAKRRGLTGRTILAVIWLVVSFALSYFFATWILNGELLGIDYFYNQMGIPDSVNEVIIQIGLAVVVFTAFQFFLLIGYAIASPKAKMRPGTPTIYTAEKDPYDTTFN